VLLDEAQDFGTTALRFVVGLLEPGHDDLVVVADAAQNIFRRKFSWKQAGIQAQGRTRILRVNYRNTREILEFASRFLLASTALRPEEVPDPEDEAAVIPPESAQRSGPRPELEIVKDTRAEVGRAIARATEYARRSSAPRSVAVLFPGSFDSGVDRARALYDGLAATDRVFWLSDPQNKTNRDRLAEAEDPILLSTIHSAKGLEFPYVVLCGIWSDREEQEANRKLAYVGMTRATDHLAVVSRDGHPLVEDLRRAIAG
jgi:superfamily I DNA/RNA helicase